MNGIQLNESLNVPIQDQVEGERHINSALHNRENSGLDLSLRVGAATETRNNSALRYTET